ncbi:DUF2071 domain-containing protein [Adhaeribacter sp. BT258]|uniref:DUF2071 domain-containing protein n=1 Tax=Adhaeribacter terrigena TaxID=2793070 RepID=A0ABS1C5V7_9BACT|nr:DUF2071 domain-containing protein [Adhaeribacter terrigena]MBK0404764.1 DUF2071 domain-containing protein [Adhaeribacter terrigena]
MANFLTAEWRKLAFANYVIDPEILSKYVPAKTELDFWNGDCFVSLVGFKFCNTRLKGFRVPFHTDFEEVNLRFYVRHKKNGAWKRGVVFIKEIVPKPAITFVANTIYKENYVTVPMDHLWEHSDNDLKVGYRWKSGNWNTFELLAENSLQEIVTGSQEEFITEHYWGYAQASQDKTSEYEVTHPCWQVYPVKNYKIEVDFGKIYSPEFSFLATEKPKTTFLAEGSEISVKPGIFF